MPHEVLTRATKELEDARKFLNSGQELPQKRLAEIRQNLEKLRTEITNQRNSATDMEHRRKLEHSEGELNDITARIDKEIKTKEAEEAHNRPGQNPTEESMKKLETNVAEQLNRVPGPIRRFIRDIFAGMRLNFVSDWLDSHIDKENIRQMLKQKLRPELAARVRESPLDGRHAKRLRGEYRSRLRSRQQNEDTYPFEDFYREKIEAYAKNENDRKNREPNYLPSSITIGHVLEYVASSRTNNPHDVPAPGSPEAVRLQREKPALEVLHLNGILNAFNAAGANIPAVATNGDGAQANPQPNETDQQRNTRLGNRKQALAKSILDRLRNRSNGAYLYVNQNGSLLERDPYIDGSGWHFITRLSSAFSEEYDVMPEFVTNINSNPIKLFHDLMHLPAERAGTLGGRARGKLSIVQRHLRGNQTAVRHPEGLRAAGIEDAEAKAAADKEEADKKTQQQKQVTEKNNKGGAANPNPPTN